MHTHIRATNMCRLAVHAGVFDCSRAHPLLGPPQQQDRVDSKKRPQSAYSYPPSHRSTHTHARVRTTRSSFLRANASAQTHSPTHKTQTHSLAHSQTHVQRHFCRLAVPSRIESLGTLNSRPSAITMQARTPAPHIHAHTHSLTHTYTHTYTRAGSQSMLVYSTARGHIHCWDLRSNRTAWTLRNDPSLGMASLLSRMNGVMSAGLGISLSPPHFLVSKAQANTTLD